MWMKMVSLRLSAQQTQDVDLMLVYDAGPTKNQQFSSTYFVY